MKPLKSYCISCDIIKYPPLDAGRHSSLPTSDMFGNSVVVGARDGKYCRVGGSGFLKVPDVPGFSMLTSAGIAASGTHSPSVVSLQSEAESCLDGAFHFAAHRDKNANDDQDTYDDDALNINDLATNQLNEIYRLVPNMTHLAQKPELSVGSTIYVICYYALPPPSAATAPVRAE
uniref:Uncharacterized protein n=1 Tax=Romanomermis culicivorax TaxID=13658 RepID=A0A915HXD3_ROMCU